MESVDIEAWLDSHPEFVKDYFSRKANRSMVDSWMSLNTKRTRTFTSIDDDRTRVCTPYDKSRNPMLRRISAHDFMTSTGTLQPLVSSYKPIYSTLSHVLTDVYYGTWHRHKWGSKSFQVCLKNHNRR